MRRWFITPLNVRNILILHINRRYGERIVQTSVVYVKKYLYSAVLEQDLNLKSRPTTIFSGTGSYSNRLPIFSIRY